MAGPYLRVAGLLDPEPSRGLPVITGPEPVWRPSPELPPMVSATLQRAALELRERLADAIGDTVGSHRVAATLSSGMDSSAVVAACVQRGIDITAITWYMPDAPTADESKLAQRTAHELGIELVDVEIAADDLLPDEGIVTRAESPLLNMFDGAWMATGRAIQELNRPFLVTGFPGDALFSGWTAAPADMLMSLRWGRLVRYLRLVEQKGASWRYTLRREVIGPTGRQMAAAWWARRRRPVHWLHPGRHAEWRNLQKESVGPGLLPGLAERRARLGDGSLTMLADTPVLTEMGITQIHPLLDPSLIEFALSLPTWLLYEGELDKLVLRETMRDSLPDEIVGHEKVFPNELAAQALRLRREPLLELVHDMKAGAMEIVLEETLRDEVHAFMRGDHDRMEFWNALTLEDWLRRWH